MAGELAAVVLGQALDDLPPQTRRMWNALAGHVATAAAAQGIEPGRVTFMRREIQTALGWSYQQARVHLDRLAEQEYIVAASNGPGQVLRYRLAADLLAPLALLGRLTPAPVTMPDTPPPDAKSTPMASTLFGFSGVCSPLVGSGSTGSNDDKKAENIIKAAGLFGSLVHKAGGMQPDASYVGTDGPDGPADAGSQPVGPG
jgi:hypothetical protein